MFTLEDARKKQSELQKQTIIKFSIYMILIIALFVILFAFTDYLKKYSSLYAIFALLLFFMCKSTKIYNILQPKEFVGVIIYCNVNIEHVKTYASHQPGAKYDSNEVFMLELIVENDKKSLYKNIEYDWHWGEYMKGQTIAILRFVDRPILIAEPEKKV